MRVFVGCSLKMSVFFEEAVLSIHLIRELFFWILLFFQKNLDNVFKHTSDAACNLFTYDFDTSFASISS